MNQETKDKLREEYNAAFSVMLEDLKIADAVINRDGIIFEWSMNWWLSKLDDYAQEKIDASLNRKETEIKE